MIHLDIGKLHTRRQPHIFQGPLRRAALACVRKIGGCRDMAVDRQGILGAGSPGDIGDQFASIDLDFLVEMRTFVGLQRLPILDRLLIDRPLGCIGTPLDIFKGRFVRCDKSGAGACLDGHVTKGHPSFHGKGAHRLAGIFNHMTSAPCSADLADNGEGDILCRHAEGSLPFHRHPHVFRFFLHQRLRCQHMLNLGRADTMCERSEGAMGGGMGITTNNGHAWQGEPLFRADDMHDPAPVIGHGKVRHTKFGRVGFKCFHLQTAFRIGNTLLDILGRHVMIGDGKGCFGTAHLAAAGAQTFKGLRAGYFMNKMTINV